MHTQLIFSLLLLSPLCALSQTDTTYFDQDWNKTELSHAKYYRLTTKEKNKDNNYKIEDRYLSNNKVQMIGYSSRLDSEIRNGPFEYYNDGFKTSEGIYENNKRVGLWKRYYSHTNTLWYTEIYESGKYNGDLISYYKNGKKRRTDTYAKGKRTDGKVWDETGAEAPYTVFEKDPEAPYDLNEYLLKNTYFPDSMIGRKIYGNVFIRFAVNEDSTISNVTVSKGLAPAFNDEALRVIRQMPRWIPGTRDGIPDKIHITQPVLFNKLYAVFPYGRIDSTYLDKNWHKADAGHSTYLRLITREKECSYKAEMRFTDSNKLYFTGYYSNMYPITADGDFVYYSEDGHKTSEGKFENGERTGPWNYYYEHTNTLWYTCTYEKGKLNGPLVSYYKSSKLKRKEAYDNDKAVDGKCWDENGKEIDYLPFYSPAEAPYKVNAYLADNIHYPSFAVSKNIEGKVIVKFMLNEDGSISDVTISKSVAECLDEEALRVVRKMPPWKPFTIDNKPIKIAFTLPVNFKL